MSMATSVRVADRSEANHDPGAGKFIRDVFFANLPTPFEKFRTYLWLAVLARTLGPAGYGAWSLFNVSLGICVVLASMNMNSAMMRFLSGQRTIEEISRAISTVIVVVAASSAFLAVASACLAHWGGAVLFHSSDGRTLIILLAVTLPFECIFAGLKGLLRAQRLNSRWAALALARLFPETIVTVAVGAVVRNVSAVAEAYLICSLVSAIGAVFYMSRVLGIRPARPDWRISSRYLSFGLAMLPGALTYFLSVNADRYLVGYYLDLKQVGIYSVCFTISALAFFIVGPINDVLFPELSALYDAGDMRAFVSRFGGIQKFVFAVAMGATALQIAFPADILRLLASKEYSSGHSALAILGLNGVFMAFQVLYSAILNVRLKVWSYSWLWVGTGAGVVVLDSILLPKIGIAGAAVSQLVTSIIGGSIMIGMNWSLFKESFPLRWVAQNGVGLGAVLLVAVCWDHHSAVSPAMTAIRISAGAAAFLVAVTLAGYMQLSDLRVFARAFSLKEL